jgi:hypothetical protein
VSDEDDETNTFKSGSQLEVEVELETEGEEAFSSKIEFYDVNKTTTVRQRQLIQVGNNSDAAGAVFLFSAISRKANDVSFNIRAREMTETGEREFIRNWKIQVSVKVSPLGIQWQLTN